MLSVLVKSPKVWEPPESVVTPEGIYLNRREVIRGLGIAGAALGISGCGLSVEGLEIDPDSCGPNPDTLRFESLYPAPQNTAIPAPEVSQTPEDLATTFNNFFEFTNSKEVCGLVGGFSTDPWTVEVTGEVARPQTFDLGDLMRWPQQQERIYRLRCVETWAMVIPWTGFSFASLAALVEPTADARFVRFESASQPDNMPWLASNPNYPWPYQETLTVDEAMNELTILATGAYGRPLRRQNGAPIRLVVPWKYGFKSIKSIARIEFTRDLPTTFWSSARPDLYDWISNVEPEVPHPLWSQRNETILHLDQRVPTQLYNGYQDFVAHLYA